MKTLIIFIACTFILLKCKCQYNYNEVLPGIGISAGYSSLGCLIGEGYGGLQLNEKVFTGISMKVHSKSSNTDYPIIFEPRLGYRFIESLELYGGVGYHTSSTDIKKSDKPSPYNIGAGLIYHFKESPVVISAGVSGKIYSVQIGIFGVK